MRGSPTAQSSFAISRVSVARWYAYVLQLHRRLKVEPDHGRGGARSGTGYPPSESSGSKVHDHVQPTVTAAIIILAELRAIARHARLCGRIIIVSGTKSAHYTRLNLVTKRLVIS